MNAIIKKQTLGQFFTKNNFWLQGHVLDFIKSTKTTTAFDPFAGEDPHQIVFKRQVKPAASRIALPAASAAKLKIDAAGLVSLGADDVKSAQLLDLVAIRLHFFTATDLLDELLPFIGRHFEPRGILVLKLCPGHRLRIPPLTIHHVFP